MSNIEDLVRSFGVEDGELGVGGTRVSLLALRAGGTPLFAYDRSQLTARVGRLRHALPDDVQLSYAVKANPMPAIVQHLSPLVDRFDVASAAEMRVALDTPTRADRISFAGPGKTDDELRAAIAAGVTIELESRRELRRAVAVASDVGVRPRVAVRINPPFGVKGSGMRMAGGPQQFGIDAEEVPEILPEIGEADAEFVGFHLFAGSQNLIADALIEAQRETIRLIAELARGAPEPVRYVNIGGGFGIPYFDADEALDVDAVGDALAVSVREGREAGLGGATFVVELGRYIVGPVGVYVTRIIDKKVSRGKTFLVVDGGLHHQLAAAGSFGQVIRRNFPIVSATHAGEAHDAEEAEIVGCSCTPLDLLGRNVALPAVDVGDLVAIFHAGAYGLTASPTRFLSHPDAAEMVV
ncbi:pyridoxal-dependent decarboxylase, exosortase A system-associated [Microbacterium ulmi]|uniref:Pyridoxal-dependent decarboxylase, exosortase A system-associated n=1 Tax=Microbacterium ulmi TaxID=179095 RepID=A0A7Y2LYQ8_9MICO|nr:pyridoxal-dependent decarboxylase, exosortase A system-associated [Microbacterium ulmi]NII69724.1 diaminopimelate decarboxylase [Microbacterium ulmi]NNH03301.1 pyridoxal-dependent decarboxylase, exosortase A system-associated [Microbacterium ulmi]